MANFIGPPFLLLVLAGLALCQRSSANPSTQTAITPADTTAPNSNPRQGTQTATAQPTAQPGPGNEPTITKPPLTSIHSVKTTAGTETLMKGSLPSTPSHQHLSESTSNHKATDINITSSPPSTSLQQHSSDTTLFVLASDNYRAGFPPSTPLPTSVTEPVRDSNTSLLLSNTTMQQHTHSSITTSTPTAGNLIANTSDSSRTPSTTNTTSPTLMPSTTTEESPKYNCSVDEKADGVHVKIEPNNSAVSYDITFTDSDNKTKPVKNLLIPLSSLKPCRSYTVHFNLACVEKYTTFTTRPLVDSDVSYKLDKPYRNEVCFKTKWDFKRCINITKLNSCTDYELTYKKDQCNKPVSVKVKLPPEKPVINFKNEYPTELFWTNKGNCLKNLTYECDGNTDVKDLKPFHDYRCSGFYDFENEKIKSDLITVRIECDVKNITDIRVTNSSIHTNWTLSSSNCPDIPPNITWKATCTSKTGHQSGNSCNIMNLKVYTEYSCDFEASFKGEKFQTFNINVRTKSAKPTVTKEQLHTVDHNSIKFECHIWEWNGKPGYFIAEWWYDGGTVSKRNNDKCSFKFENLHYLTSYNFKLVAINGDGDEYVSQKKSVSTKYNDKALLGFLGFLIVLTSIALLFVLYKIYLLKREKSRNEQELDDLLPSNALLPVEPISVDALLEVYKKKRADEGRLFMEEFQSVPRIYSNYSVKEAKKPDNQPKNRYVDILPYDYNRVDLSHGGTDYINASFIEGYKETNKYIAAQGPKEETMGDFWTMIWEQKTSIIVMVTRCEEGNKNKCAQYWPSLERETEIFDDLVVKMKGEEKCPDYIIRHLTLMNRKEKTAEREVTHIQFTSWPDHGVPSDPGLLLKLRRRVNSFKNFFSGPIVVHCSAGVGRTGTYICIDAMIESLEAEGRVDIYGYVVKLRRQRCLMVQVEAQYVLIHTALIEYSQFGETEMALSDFHSEVNTLRQKEVNDPSLMELEFQKLPKFKNYRPSATARTEGNKGKNRSSVVPYDFNRVLIKLDDEASHDSEAEDEEEYSSDEDDEVPSKYINASYVDGYWMPTSFIVTQGPMADTVADFLHMLFQKKVKTVFMLTNCTENDKEFCSQYWDDEKKTFGEMVVKVKETEYTPTYIRRCLEIQHTKRKDSHTLQQYHFLKWAGHELPSNPHDLIDMMRSVRQRSDNSNKNKNLPVLVHCSDGSSRSGIFCALWKLLDSTDTEKLVDIFQVAKDLRKARMGMLNTFEQYEFLYAALEAAYPVQNGELKKPSGAPADSVQVINESTALISPSTDDGTEERTKESTDSVPPEEGATEASSEPENDLSENTSNGPTSVVEV